MNRYHLTYITMASLTIVTPAVANNASTSTQSNSDYVAPVVTAVTDDKADSHMDESAVTRSSQTVESTPQSSSSAATVASSSFSMDQLSQQTNAFLNPNDTTANWGWVDEERHGVQSHLHRWANTMNGWFGEPDPRQPATANLRVIMDTRWEDDPNAGSHVTVEPRIRGRLRLPVLERRLSLIIGDEALDNENVLTQDATGKSYQAQTIEQDKVVDAKKARDNNASIALRWSRFSEDIERELGINTDIDLGVRSGNDVFIKVSVDKDWYKSDKWLVNSDNFYRYGSDSEHYIQGALNLQYGGAQDKYINNRSTIRYRHEDDDERTDWSNDLRQVYNFTNNKQLSYGLSASGNFDDDKHLLNSYGPAISYRQPIWREWLYVQTELNYYNDKDENKSHYPSALLRLEALF